MVTLLSDENGNDETVDTQDTSHDDGNDRLHDQFRLQDTHTADTNTTLSGTISSTQIWKNCLEKGGGQRLTGKDEGGRDTNETEEIGRAVNSVTSLSGEEKHVFELYFDDFKGLFNFYKEITT